MNKAHRYLDLVEQRRRCTVCPPLANPAAIDSGAFDCDEIGPYSQ